MAYNPRSSKCKLIRKEVIDVLQSERGVIFGKYEVIRANVDENAKRLAKVLCDGDLVISAGGDGTATMVLNAVILSKKKVRMAVLPYGNFNDLARELRCRNVLQVLESDKIGQTKRLFPLEMKCDGKHFRYAACYFTLGMFAESTEAFNEKKTREKLKKGKKGMIFSAKVLFLWWLARRKKGFLPESVKVNGRNYTHISDIMAVNSKTVAKCMRGDAKMAFLKGEFLGVVGKMDRLWEILRFMSKSMLKMVPGEKMGKMKVEFDKPTRLMVQAEGEYEWKKCERIEISKVENPVEVVVY